MAVPKRKMSRSNTRSRRAQWKATAAPLAAVQALPRAEAAARRLPDLRHLQQPPGPGRLSDGTGHSVSAQAEPAGADWHGELCALLDVTVDVDLLERALTHRSFAYENGGLPTNERLEFLGDSVLGLVVTDTLYRSHPDLPEGQLAKLRAAVVNMRALAEVGARPRPRRVHPARPRRGDHRRPGQGLDPRRHPRGGDRRGLPRPAASTPPPTWSTGSSTR